MRFSLFDRTAAPAILLVSAWLLVVDNRHYWQLMFAESSEHGAAGIALLLSVFIFSLALINAVLTLLAYGRATRYVLSAVLCVSAVAAWFMNRYGVLLDQDMIGNIFETDRAEAMELIGPGLLSSLALYGVLPAMLIWRMVPARQSISRTLREKAVVLAISLAVVTLAVGPFFKVYASLALNHGEIRYLLTPVNYIHSLATYTVDAVHHRVVTVLVIGETARGDHFSLDGYERDTTPQLAERDIIYFSHVTSCGTATRVSLPCMFSNLGRADYSKSKAKRREGLLDVLNHAGIRTVWLDNNSGCKGVCKNSPTWRTEDLDIGNGCKEGECFDEVLLPVLEQAVLDSDRDTVIVLHQNGSHGPAYYRRYPDAFSRFTPDCRSDDFADCTQEQIVNSYDNTIYYTDDFLSRIIDMLGHHDEQLDTALMYVSDHGESLGEYGLYLHGTPFFLAPEGQKHVPMLLWMSPHYQQDFQYDRDCLKGRHDAVLSHDNLFHSVLGLLDIGTAEHRPELDIFDGCSGQRKTAVAAQLPPSTGGRNPGAFSSADGPPRSG
jgi:lipid A ethanolaminephosphotransferase